MAWTRARFAERLTRRRGRRSGRIPNLGWMPASALQPHARPDDRRRARARRLAMMALEAQLSAYNERACAQRRRGGARRRVRPDAAAYPGVRADGRRGRVHPCSDRERGPGASRCSRRSRRSSSGPCLARRRWSFRVLVLPGAPLVTTGPYRYLRHPNYLAVLGEFAGVALALAAPVTGALAPPASHG